VLRVEVSEDERDALPAIDVDADAERVIIGSGPAAQIRIPAQVARPEHVRLEGTRWIAVEPVRVDARPCKAGDHGAIGAGVGFELGAYRIRVAPAPPGTQATPPQRTESLARELVRGLLGAGAAPVFEIVRGPRVDAGAPGSPATWARRELPPPEATVIVGRGDEAGWVILDEDLSRQHAEIRRGWDGVTIRDLESKNGTLVGGVRIASATALADGDRIELGNSELVFRDPAERHLRGDITPMAKPAPKRAQQPPPISPRKAGTRAPFWIAAAIAGLATAGLVWVLAS
jgi:hypothetical protein